MSKKWTKADEKRLVAMQGRMTLGELARKFSVSPREIKMKLTESAKGRRLKNKPKNAVPRVRAARPRSNGRPTAGAEAATFARALNLFDRGVELFNSRKFDKAQRVFREIIEKMADEREFHDRAHLYLNLIQRQLKPVEPRPRNYEDYYNRAIYHLNLGDYDRSIGFLKKANDKKPKDPSITYFLALAFAGKNDVKASVIHLRQAIELDGENRVLARNETEFQAMLEHPEIREVLYPERGGGADPHSASS